MIFSFGKELFLQGDDVQTFFILELIQLAEKNSFHLNSNLREFCSI
jgi:hypothetical protein